MKFDNPFWDKFAEFSLPSRALFDFPTQLEDQERRKRLGETLYIESVYEEIKQSSKEDFHAP